MNLVSAAPILPLPAFQREGGLRPEAHLLLGCARLTIGSDMRAEIEARMGSDLDCDQLRRLAARHALFPLLYRNLNVIAPTAIPRPLFVQLWAYHEKLCLRNQAMAEALLEILARLDSNGIPAIPFKGPALAQSVYGDLALREFGDLDILIRPKDLLAAKEALKAAGFVPEYDLTPSVEAAFLRSSAQYHLVMRNEARDVLVELHWKTDPDHPVESDSDDWWANLGTTQLGEARVPCFAPYELLLVLCFHGSKHFWGSLGWLVDVAELIRQHPEMNWAWVLAKAEELRAMRRLALGLYLAHHLLDAPIPDEVLRRVQSTPMVEGLARRITSTIFDVETKPPGPFQLLRLNLLLHERFNKKLVCVFNQILAPSLVEWTRWPLPRPLFFFYIPLRLFRLMKKHLLG